MRWGRMAAATAAVWALAGTAAASEPVSGESETFALGAGALGYVGQGANVERPSAVAWSFRYGWTPDPGVTWEMVYVGATDAVEDGVATATLATLVETNLKLDLVPQATVHPFVGGGVGYGAFTGWANDVWTLTTPVLAGVELDMGNLVIGTRLTARPTFFDRAPLTDLGADSWSLTADLGSRF
jgi:opacity protein-like surface antigen